MNQQEIDYLYIQSQSNAEQAAELSALRESVATLTAQNAEQAKEIGLLKKSLIHWVAQDLAELESTQLDEQMSRDVLEDLEAMKLYPKWAKEAEEQERIEHDAWLSENAPAPQAEQAE